MDKKNSFLFSLLFVFVLVMSLLSVFSVFPTLIGSIQQLLFGNILLGVFILLIISLFINVFLIPGLKSGQKIVDIVLIFSIIALLLLSIFDRQIGIYGTGFFILCTLVYVISTRNLYSLHPIYLLVFTYPLLDFVGTIGTSRGFRFPDMTLTFYIIPLAFSCFRIEKEMLLQILRFVFRAILIFMALSIVNWYFNKIQTEIGVIEWISKKVAINGIPAYQFVCSWAHYKHPSYINLVLLPTLISGFYLYHKKESKSFVSSIELLLFVLFCVFMQLIMESRIGLVGVIFILIVTGLYYMHLKKIYFKIALISTFVLGGTGLVVMENSVSNFVDDPVRKIYSSLAIHYIKGHIWWGAGYDGEANVLTQQQEELRGIVPIDTQPKCYTHNELLGTMVQFGIPGAIVLLVMMFGLFWYSFRSRNYLLQLFICMYLLFMLIEEPLYVQEGITRFTVFLTFFISLGNSDKEIKSYTLLKGFPKR